MFSPIKIPIFFQYCPFPFLFLLLPKLFMIYNILSTFILLLHNLLIHTMRSTSYHNCNAFDGRTLISGIAFLFLLLFASCSLIKPQQSREKDASEMTEAVHKSPTQTMLLIRKCYTHVSLLMNIFCLPFHHTVCAFICVCVRRGICVVCRSMLLNSITYYSR